MAELLPLVARAGRAEEGRGGEVVALDDGARVVVGGEQGFEFAAERAVTRAGVLQETGPLLAGPFEGLISRWTIKFW